MDSELDASVKRELTFRAEAAREKAELAQQLMEAKVRVTLAAAQSLLEQAGTPRRDETETVTWTAINQDSRESQHISLAKLRLGETWLGQTTDFRSDESVPLG